jgi:tRNA-dihydrouridine synthase C
MQDVTTLEFMRVIARYGGPDVYWTEYFRVHGDSRPEKWILDSITKNPTGKPVVAQLIGNDIPALVRTATLAMAGTLSTASRCPSSRFSFR